jgi:hypothetical protein
MLRRYYGKVGNEIIARKTSGVNRKSIFIIDKTNHDLVCMIPKKLYIMGIKVLRMSTKTERSHKTKLSFGPV